MNRIFHLILIATALLLAGFFLLLIASMVLELGKTGFVRPPKADEILFAVRLSLLTATAASLLAVAISLPVAYLLSRYRFFGKSALDTLLDLPIVLSPIALGAMLLVFFNTPLGRALNRGLGPFVFEVRGIVLAQFLVVVGLSIRLLKETFEGIDVEFEHIARTLGCSRLRAFTRVVLPMAKRGILASFLLVWARALGEFGATVTLAGATPFKTETLPVAIFLSLESADVSSAVAFILMLITLSLAILFCVRKTGVFRHA